MMELDVKQNTDEWHKERATRIGSSDSPIIMGVSPWKTAFKLWEEKAGFSEKIDEPNYITEKGHNLEPIARQHHELETGLKTEKKTFVHDQFPFLIASLDGWNQEKKIVLEIKFTGKDNHELAKSGKVPDHYYPQIQHQLFVSNAEMCHYFSFDGTEGVLVYVPRDNEYINKEWLPKVLEFHSLILTKQPPELSDRDFKKITNQKLSELIASYDKHAAEAKAAEKKAEALKEEIFKMMDHDRVVCGGRKLIHGYRKGAVDYDAIPQLEGVNLEQFRKPATRFRKIS